MNIGSNEVESIQRLVAAGGVERLTAIPDVRLTIGAALELSCCEAIWKQCDCAAITSTFSLWANSNGLLRASQRALNHDGVWALPESEVFGAPDFEVIPAPLEGQWDSLPWNEFLDRLRRSLTKGHFTPSLSRALSKAFAEMADNITQHSGVDRQHQARGLVAYGVSGTTMTFSVADIGRGVLDSLRTKPTLSHLSHHADALRAAILGNMSSRPNELTGDGFRTVLNSLTDLNGSLRFRTGDACLTLAGLGDARSRTISFVPPLAGFQLSVTCSLGTGAEELYF